MKIVIDIPEDEYDAIMGNISNKFSVYDLIASIKCGTPLPKQHGRLIDADKLCDSFEPSDFDDEPWDNVDNACRIIHSMPVIDAVSMKVIDDVKAEIKSHDDQKHYPYGVIGIRTVLQIIDKHIGERSNNEIDS